MTIDFWGDNPFAEIELPFPPVPSGQDIGKSITRRSAPVNNELRRLQGKTDLESEAKRARLEAEDKRLKELRKKLIVKARELRGTLPFDTLLAVQAIAPDAFAQRKARSSVAAAAWHALWGEDETLALSDADRASSAKDFTSNPLLDGQEQAERSHP